MKPAPVKFEYRLRQIKSKRFYRQANWSHMKSKSWTVSWTKNIQLARIVDDVDEAETLAARCVVGTVEIVEYEVTEVRILTPTNKEF